MPKSPTLKRKRRNGGASPTKFPPPPLWSSTRALGNSCNCDTSSSDHQWRRGIQSSTALWCHHVEGGKQLSPPQLSTKRQPYFVTMPHLKSSSLRVSPPRTKHGVVGMTTGLHARNTGFWAMTTDDGGAANTPTPTPPPQGGGDVAKMVLRKTR